MVALETIFKVFLGIIAVVTVAFMINKYLSVDINIDLNKNTKRNLQVIVLNSDEDLTKAIYSCYSMSNFGENNEMIQCYIIKSNTVINWNNVKSQLYSYGISERAYETPTISSGNILLMYYEDYKIKFKSIQ